MAEEVSQTTHQEAFNILTWNKKGDFKVVVGIDFGTDGSAVAWALNDGENKVHIAQEMNDNKTFVDLKSKTNLLLTDEGAFIAFGREATEKYIRQFQQDNDEDDDDEPEAESKDSIEKPKAKKKSAKKKSQSWLYFDQFKMALYKKAIKRQTQITRGGDPIAVASQSMSDDEFGDEGQYKTDIQSQLRAANGKKLSSRIVFVEALKFMKRHTMRLFERNQVQITDPKDIKWVLTVPAIWSDKSKGLMEQWAMEAGLIEDAKQLNQLVIAYEPDCASISIQNEIKDYKKLMHKNLKQRDDEKNGDEKKKQKKDKQYFLQDEKYLLLDLGGGTADIACHQVVDDYAVKEVFQPSGGAWGSSHIDKHFLRMLSDLLPKGWLHEFRVLHPSEFTALKRNFQRAKESFYAREAKHNSNADDPSKTAYQKQQTHNVTMPFELIMFLVEKLDALNVKRTQQNEKEFGTLEEYFQEQTFLGTPGKWKLDEDKLEVDYSIWTHMFDEVIDRIIDHCRELLKTPQLCDKQCRYICLVGGFCSSRYLQNRVMYELGIRSVNRLIVIVPKRPSLCVVDGAVRLGLKPDFIQSRIITKTYGIKVNAPAYKFDLKALPAQLVEENIYFNTRANKKFLHNIFHAYVRKGDEVNITDPATTTKFYASRNHIVGIEVYASEDINPVFVDGNPITRKDVILPDGWDIHTTFPISFFFGDTTIRVFADIEGIEDHEKEIKLEYKFS